MRLDKKQFKELLFVKIKTTNILYCELIALVSFKLLFNEKNQKSGKIFEKFLLFCRLFI